MYRATESYVALDEFERSAPGAPGRRTLTASLPASRAVQRQVVTAAPPTPAAPVPASADPFWFAGAGAAHAWPVQRQAGGTLRLDPSQLPAVAEAGTRTAGGPLPHLDAIQRSFGAHDVSHVTAHIDGAGAAAAAAMGAAGFAFGDHVGFAGAPTLHTAAHEAAHVVQQRAGVQLAGGVGIAGDRYEQHADAVADRVVRGESAEDLLAPFAAGGGGAGLQLKLLLVAGTGWADPTKLHRSVICESGLFFDTETGVQYKLVEFVSERVMRVKGVDGDRHYDLQQDQFIEVNDESMKIDFGHRQQEQLAQVVREHEQSQMLLRPSQPQPIREFGGRVYEAAPQNTTHIGYHYTSVGGAASLRTHGIAIDRKINGTGGAVNGYNRDGEGFYLTTDPGWPYSSPHQDCLRFAVFVDAGALDRLRSVPRNGTGFEQVKWWQDDDKMRAFITDCDFIVRQEAATDLKFNPHAVKYLALVHLDTKPGNPELMRRREEMFPQVKPSSSLLDTVPPEHQQTVLDRFRDVERNSVEQVERMRKMESEIGVKWRGIAQFLREKGLRD